MIYRNKIIALAAGIFALSLTGCVSFESDVFASSSTAPVTASTAPVTEEKPLMFAQSESIPVDELPLVDLRSTSPR